MIQSALVARLKTVHSRTYAHVTPAKCQLPAVTIDLTGSFRERHWSGGSTTTGLIDTDFEISVWSSTEGGAQGLAKSIIANLENFSGPLRGLDSPQTIYRVSDLEIVNETSGFDGESELHTYSIFITISHTTES